jgi:hypothetical protein
MEDYGKGKSLTHQYGKEVPPPAYDQPGSAETSTPIQTSVEEAPPPIYRPPPFTTDGRSITFLSSDSQLSQYSLSSNLF